MYINNHNTIILETFKRKHNILFFYLKKIKNKKLYFKYSDGFYRRDKVYKSFIKYIEVYKMLYT